MQYFPKKHISVDLCQSLTFQAVIKGSYNLETSGKIQGSEIIPSTIIMLGHGQTGKYVRSYRHCWYAIVLVKFCFYEKIMEKDK